MLPNTTILLFLAGLLALLGLVLCLMARYAFVGCQGQEKHVVRRCLAGAGGLLLLFSLSVFTAAMTILLGVHKYWF